VCDALSYTHCKRRRPLPPRILPLVEAPSDEILTESPFYGHLCVIQ
jgi:hypothetical protein